MRAATAEPAIADPGVPGSPASVLPRAWAIRLAAWARSGTGGLSSEGRPGSLAPAAQCVRAKASTIAGSNWMPANRRSSSIAWSLVSGVIR